MIATETAKNEAAAQVAAWQFYLDIVQANRSLVSTSYERNDVPLSKVDAGEAMCRVLIRLGNEAIAAVKMAGLPNGSFGLHWYGAEE